MVHVPVGEVKHFCCNNQEGKYFFIGEKEYSSSDLDERTLREIYLPGFEARAEPTGASGENVQRVASGDMDLALCNGDRMIAAHAAFRFQ